MNEIRLRGAAEHNLRSIDLDLPHGHWIAVTGPSGSGKTSLVFDTLVREGQHRYLGALSARARHFFGKLGRDVRFYEFECHVNIPIVCVPIDDGQLGVAHQHYQLDTGTRPQSIDTP